MTDAEFVPVLRFAVCSDLHIKEADDDHVRRLRQMMRCVYAEAEKDAAFRRVDAFVFAGDLADHGTKAQFEAFWQTVQAEKRGDTRILSILAKNHDNWEHGRSGKKTGLRHYAALSGQPKDFDVCLGGFTFLGISTCNSKRRYYSLRQKLWLRRALENAAHRAPGLPVFVFQHEHVKNTVYGSSDFDGWGNAYFKRIFERFPQIVHFSGHSHYPLNDPRSVWQGALTAVGTGTMSYAEFTVDSERTVHPEACETIAQGWIVEADKDGRLRLRGFDFLSGTELCRYDLGRPGNEASLCLTPAQQKAKSRPPRFPAGAALLTQRAADTLRVTVPAAESTDGFPVFLYRAELRDEHGTVLSCAYVLHEYWFAHEKPFYSIDLPLQNGAFAVCVQAENAYGMASAPLTKEVI